MKVNLLSLVLEIGALPVSLLNTSDLCIAGCCGQPNSVGRSEVEHPKALCVNRTPTSYI